MKNNNLKDCILIDVTATCVQLLPVGKAINIMAYVPKTDAFKLLESIDEDLIREYLKCQQGVVSG
jgi:hypothetical protein